MPLQHACFISYRHPHIQNEDTRKQAEKIITAFKDSLEYQLSFYTGMRPYLDTDRLRGGQFFNPAIAKALCESVCLVVVYYPTYFESLYCAREYRAMELLEEKRLPMLPQAERQDGLVIPTIFKGEEYFPAYVSRHRQYYNFSGLKPWDPPLYKHRKYANDLDNLAQYIARLCKRFDRLAQKADPCVECNDPHRPFDLPSDAEITPWLSKVISPDEDQVPYPLRAA